jgi:hypothetical protein
MTLPLQPKPSNQTSKFMRFLMKIALLILAFTLFTLIVWGLWNAVVPQLMESVGNTDTFKDLSGWGAAGLTLFLTMFLSGGPHTAKMLYDWDLDVIQSIEDIPKQMSQQMAQQPTAQMAQQPTAQTQNAEQFAFESEWY